MAFVYNSQLDAFETYHKIQESSGGLGSATDGVGLPALGHALAGSAGTAVSHLILYPLDLVITRLQVQKQLRGSQEAESAAEEAGIEYEGLLDAANKIYKSEGGWNAFYAGVFTDTSKSIIDAFLFFLAYTYLRQRRQQSLGAKNLPVLDEIRVGMTAGAFSKFITTPIQQIVTRKQTAAMVAARDPTSSLPPDQTKNLSVKDIALQIRQERGIRGFWAGYSASLVLTLNPSLTFLFQNSLKQILLPASKRDSPPAQVIFLIAAFSKVLASTVMYPFSLAKTRAQVSASHPSPVVEKGSDSGSPPVYLDKPDLESSPTAYKAKKYTRSALAAITSHIRQQPIISTLRHIYRAEGLLGLYSGLEGEILKGFLGHGLTMLLKENIHVGIISLYYFVLKMLKRWPAQLGGVTEQAGKEMGRVRTVLGTAAQDTKEGMENIAVTVKEGAVNAVSGNKDQ